MSTLRVKDHPIESVSINVVGDRTSCTVDPANFETPQHERARKRYAARVSAWSTVRQAMANKEIAAIGAGESTSLHTSHAAGARSRLPRRSGPVHFVMLNQPNEKDGSYSMVLETPASTPGLTCALRVHWATSLHMAPLEIIYSPPSLNETYKRRVVVQLPSVVPTPVVETDSGAPSMHEREHDGGRPIVYESLHEREPLGSGWICYMVGVGIGRARAQGFVKLRVNVKPHSASAPGSAADKELHERSVRWIERLQEATEEMTTEAVGQIREVQGALVHGASLRLPLPTIPDHPLLPAGKDLGQQLMLRSVCSGADPQISHMYDELCAIVRSDGDGAAMLSQILPDKDGNDESRPKGFYLVAMDIPGFGRTERAGIEGSLINVKLLSDVIRSLSKQHAFAIVAHAQSAADLLKTLLADPKLASFLVLREADTESLDVDSLHGVLHPTLAPYDPDGSQVMVRATRSLNAVLPQLTFVKFSLEATPTFWNHQLAKEMMAFFRTNNWRGAQPTTGNSSKLALLTRLAGGLNRWKGNPRLEKKVIKEKEKTKARSKDVHALTFSSGGSRFDADADVLPAMDMKGAVSASTLVRENAEVTVARTEALLQPVAAGCTLPDAAPAGSSLPRASPPPPRPPPPAAAQCPIAAPMDVTALAMDGRQRHTSRRDRRSSAPTIPTVGRTSQHVGRHISSDMVMQAAFPGEVGVTTTRTGVATSRREVKPTASKASTARARAAPLGETVHASSTERLRRARRRTAPF